MSVVELITVAIIMVSSVAISTFVTPGIFALLEFLNSALFGKYCLEFSLLLVGILSSYGLMYLLNDLDNKFDLQMIKLKNSIIEKDCQIKKLTFELENKKKTIGKLSRQLKQKIMPSDEFEDASIKGFGFARKKDFTEDDISLSE